MKKVIALIASLMLCFLSTGSVLAADISELSNVGPRAIEISNYYTVKNQKDIGSRSNQYVKQITGWAYTSKHVVNKGTLLTVGLKTSASSGTFTSALVSRAGAFNSSLTKRVTEDIPFPADQSRKSAVMQYQNQKMYTADLYHVTEYASGKISETKFGSGTVYEPTTTYCGLVYY